MDEVAILILVVSFVLTVIWLIIGWRLMRAHERIADGLDSFLASGPGGHQDSPEPDVASRRREVIDKLTQGGT